MLLFIELLGMFFACIELKITICIDFVKFLTAFSILSFVFSEMFKLVRFSRFLEKQFQLTGPFAKEGRGGF